MRTAAAVILLALIGSLAQAADQSACGASYPAEFPCLTGGAAAQAPSVQLPGLKGLALVVYAESVAEFSERFVKAVETQGWQVQSRTGHETEGARIRMQISRDGRALSASIYADRGQTVLQIMEWSSEGGA